MTVPWRFSRAAHSFRQSSQPLGPDVGPSLDSQVYQVRLSGRMGSGLTVLLGKCPSTERERIAVTCSISSRLSVMI